MTNIHLKTLHAPIDLQENSPEDNQSTQRPKRRAPTPSLPQPQNQPRTPHDTTANSPIGLCMEKYANKIMFVI